jgi:hypothetical protein
MPYWSHSEPKKEGRRTFRFLHPCRGLLPFLFAVLSLSARTPGTAAAAVSEVRAQIHTYLPTPREAAFLDTLEERTFRWFWDLSDPRTGLTPDRAPTRSFASVSASGFALTAYPIGAERGYITRTEAARRVLTTLRFFWEAPQDTTRSAAIGYQGFFYHFLVPETGHRFGDVELSTMDTALFLAGALFCQSYFDGPTAQEDSIRTIAEKLYTRADWRWASVRPPAIGHGWDPENGFLPFDWRGYNEVMILYILALGSPTHGVDAAAWKEWLSGYRWGEYHGEEHVGFAPLFGHQFTECWVDLRGIQDSVMARHGLDYFENCRRAVLAQYAYAEINPGRWTGYGPRLWGLTACDGPVNQELKMGGIARTFYTYWARGASFTAINDDGTVAPTAAAASLPFAPELVFPTLVAMREDYGDALFTTYGFVDALNPTFKEAVPVQHGWVKPGVGWFDIDCLGIDQGPILIMCENWRSGLVWRTMQRNPHLIRGLKAAGFHGGWLETVRESP